MWHDLNILATSDSDLHVKVKESLLVPRDEPISNKNETSLPLYLFDPSHMKLYFNDIYHCYSYCIILTIVKLLKLNAPRGINKVW